MRYPAWVNVIQGVPTQSLFDTTQGAGSPITVDSLTDIAYYFDGVNVRAISAFGLITPEMFGAVGNGITDDTVAMQAAIDYVENIAGMLWLNPDSTYFVTALISNEPNFAMFSRGGILLAANTIQTATLRLIADHAFVDGVIFQLTGGDANPWHVSVENNYITLQNCSFVKDDNTGGYQGFALYGADHFTFRNNRWSGSNGWFQEGSDALYDSCEMLARTDGGGDDGVAIKAIQGVTHTIKVVNCHIEGHADIACIGTEVGTLGANDAAHSKGVRGVLVSGCSAINCGIGIYIKPGVGASDYRDGFTNDVTIENCIFEDMTGSKFERFVVVTSGRGNWIDDIKIGINQVRGRTFGDEASGHKKLIDIWVQNMGTGGNPKINNVQIAGLNFTDPYSGAVFGTAGTVGYPLINILNIQDDMGGGNITDIKVDITANGCEENGVVLGAGIDDQVTFDRIFIKNANTIANAANGGIYADSRYLLGEYNFTLGAGSNFKGTFSKPVFKKFSGAMVRKAADQIGVDLSAGQNITWDTEVYDLKDRFNSAVANTKLLTLAEDNYVEVGGTITFANVTVGTVITVICRKNGSTGYDGTAQFSIAAPTTSPCLNIRTGPVPVVGGTDYFEFVVFTPGDASVDITAARTNFWIRPVA